MKKFLGSSIISGDNFSKISIQWLEWEINRNGVVIHQGLKGVRSKFKSQGVVFTK